MNLIIEYSICNRIIQVIELVRRNWGVGWDEYRVIDNITSEPFNQLDFVKDGKPWKLILPATGGTCFFIDYNLHTDQILTYAGGAIGDGNKLLDNGDKISIVVCGNESDELLELRFIHELLHSSDLPADSLKEYTPKFLNIWDRFVFWWLQYTKESPEQYPCFQRMFYKWLLQQRSNGVM